MSEKIRSGNYAAIDLTKFFMAICVVAIHTWGTPVCSPAQDKIYGCVVNCAVPFFFLASGFFLGRKVHNAAPACTQTIIFKYLFRTLKLYTIWYVIYLPLAVFYFYANGYSLIHGILSTVRGYIFVGKNYYSDMLWYLLSTVYALLFAACLLKCRVRLRTTVFCGIICHLIGTQLTEFAGYQGELSGILAAIQKILTLTIGNGRLLTGFSYIPLGMLLARKNLSCRTGALMAAAGFAGNYFLDGLAGTLMLAVCATGIFVVASRIRLPDSPAYFYFRKSSTAIYFVHQFVWVLFCFAVYQQDVQNFSVFLTVLAISIVLSGIWLFFSKVSSKKQNMKTVS